MTHYTVQFNSATPELAKVSSLEQERFQGTLDNWRGMHQLEFCWPSFSGCRHSNLELSTGTHRLISLVAVLQASLENVFTATIFLPRALKWTW